MPILLNPKINDVLIVHDGIKLKRQMKQTAADFLSEKYMYVTWLRNRDEISSEQADKMRTQYLAEAKDMERMQIKDAYSAGVWEIGCFNRKADAKKYYEKTYEKKW